MTASRLAVSIAVVGALGSVLAAASGGASSPFKVTSTLDGKTVLPHRIRWIGSTTIPDSQVTHVDFLIDGVLRWTWIGKEVPYVYGGHEGGGSHPAYLVTSFLAPGRHRFTVRAVAKDGRVAADTVTARVLPAPVVPSQLAGMWTRAIPDTSGAPAPGSPGNPTSTLTPAGSWTLVFDKRWIETRFPGPFDAKTSGNTGSGWILDSDWTPGATTFAVADAISIQPLVDNSQRGCSWCHWDGPAATYSWSVSGDTLTLAPIGGHDACGVRGFVWAGTWTRAR